VQFAQHGRITKEEYDEWRYRFLKGSTHYTSVPSQELSDALLDAMKEEKNK